jgi:hypothetical protein
VVEELSPE